MDKYIGPVECLRGWPAGLAPAPGGGLHAGCPPGVDDRAGPLRSRSRASIRQQAQREREIETIFRGEEVADAIRVYYSYQQGRVGGRGDAALPTSIDQLLEGIPRGTKKVQILRASAARDPLSDSGEWRLVRPRSSQITDFTRDIMLFAENVRPTTRDPQLAAVERDMAPIVLPTLGIASTGSSSSSDDSSSGPFIGVATSSKSKSIINYYGIDHHDGWIFTPLFR